MRSAAFLLLLAPAIFGQQTNVITPEQQNRLLANALKNLKLRQPAAVPQKISPLKPNCGHIITVPANPAVDPDIAIQPTVQSNMPTYPGLPACK